MCNSTHIVLGDLFLDCVTRLPAGALMLLHKKLGPRGCCLWVNWRCEQGYDQCASPAAQGSRSHGTFPTFLTPSCWSRCPWCNSFLFLMTSSLFMLAFCSNHWAGFCKVFFIAAKLSSQAVSPAKRVNSALTARNVGYCCLRTLS